MFLSAYRLSGSNLDDEDLVIGITSLSWLKRTARLYYDNRLRSIKIADEVVNSLKKHFIHVCVHRINEECCNSLTYDFVRRRLQPQSPTGGRISYKSTLKLSLFRDIYSRRPSRLCAKER